MNFNLVEMYNGLLRFNKHILNELAEGLKHLPIDGSDGDVGVRVPEFYICVKDTGTKYQLWISDFNIDGTFTRVHPFIISHTKTIFCS